MSDDEDYDITKSLALVGREEDSDSGHSSDEGDLQDIIDSSDDEKAVKEKTKPVKKAEKKRKLNDTTAFPSLELSDDDDEDDSKDIAAYFTENNPQAKKAKSGTFASFGFSKLLLGNIAKKGFKQPTPIQRKTIPLIMDNRDVVGMARTGSGKTAAFTLPVIEKLKAHSAKVGIRAVFLSPARELALQTFRQVKEFSKGTDLRSIILTGGDSLEEQFNSMVSNPDIIVATPGRFLHLKVEMDLDLRTVEYIVFDEADRLFEMGFAEQLNELLASLPASRQSLLFSATLPSTLVEFAKAGLTNPVLVRLDAESKISEHLQMAFISTKKDEREANLLFILQDVIKLPIGTQEQLKKLRDLDKRQMEEDEEEEEARNNDGKKRKFKFKKERLPPANQLPSEHSTIVFVPTKHHVEYITNVLKKAGYLVSYIYGTLDQHARKNQLYQFRIGLTNILVVTDVAARGIDIPVLANVINFTLPGSSKIFIHRVGRTARAGNKGWAYSIVNEKELPYLLDLELFLGKKVLLTTMHERKCELLKERDGDKYVEPKVSYTDRLVLGSAPRLTLENSQELYENLLRNHYELKIIKDVAVKGEKLYYRTRQAASNESLKRSKEIVVTGTWDEQNILFGPNLEREKDKFLAKLENRISKETVFEFNKKGNDRAEDSFVEFMHKRRKQLAPIQRRAKDRRELLDKERIAGFSHGIENEILNQEGEVGYSSIQLEAADEDDVKETFEDADQIEFDKKQKKKSYRDEKFFLSHYAPASVIQDQQLSLGNSFANEAAGATFDLANDEKVTNNKQVMQWDRKKGNYVNALSTDKKFIIGESGKRIPATYKSGKFDEWKKQRNFQPAKVGSVETDKGKTDQRFKHKKVTAPKLPDKYRDDYHKQKAKVIKATDSGLRVKGYNKPGQQQEIRSTEQIRKGRVQKENRKAKNARPSKGSKRR